MLAQSPQTTAFVHVNVIPMDTERVLENQTVLVQGERITAIGLAQEVALPDGAEVIEGKGAYLVPGLADMHMHIMSGFGYTFEGPDQLWLYLAEGVTTVRNMSAMPEHLFWHQEIARGERMGPAMVGGQQVVGSHTRNRIGVMARGQWFTQADLGVGRRVRGDIQMSIANGFTF